MEVIDMSYVATITKALLAGAIAGAGAVAVGYSDGAITTAEIWTAVASGLTALGVVWGVPNKTQS
jgi:hypothetical protein